MVIGGTLNLFNTNSHIFNTGLRSAAYQKRDSSAGVFL